MSTQAFLDGNQSELGLLIDLQGEGDMEIEEFKSRWSALKTKRRYLEEELKLVDAELSEFEKSVFGITAGDTLDASSMFRFFENCTELFKGGKKDE